MVSLSNHPPHPALRLGKAEPFAYEGDAPTGVLKLNRFSISQLERE
jgi:hypothetical protein